MQTQKFRFGSIKAGNCSILPIYKQLQMKIHGFIQILCSMKRLFWTTIAKMTNCREDIKTFDPCHHFLVDFFNRRIMTWLRKFNLLSSHLSSCTLGQAESTSVSASNCPSLTSVLTANTEPDPTARKGTPLQRSEPLKSTKKSTYKIPAQIHNLLNDDLSGVTFIWIEPDPRHIRQNRLDRVGKSRASVLHWDEKAGRPNRDQRQPLLLNARRELEKGK